MPLGTNALVVNSVVVLGTTFAMIQEAGRLKAEAQPVVLCRLRLEQGGSPRPPPGL